MAGPSLQTKLHLLFLKIWETGEVPKDLKDALIVTIFKKGSRAECGNYRGISLLSVIGKALAKVLQTRLSKLSESILPESQCGYRPDRGTIDMIFSLRQLQEKSREQRQPLYILYYDLIKAFDLVPRSALWIVLEKFGCPPKYMKVLKALHADMEGRVIYKGDISGPFPIESGVKQGDVIAPILFDVYLAAMLLSIPPPAENGIKVRYRYDGGGLFNLSRLKTRGKTETVSVREFQFADDNAIVDNDAESLQIQSNQFVEGYERFGLKVGIHKTKVLAQAAPGEDIPPFEIKIHDDIVEQVDRFTYLGSIQTEDAYSTDEITNRIRLASAAYGKLNQRVFSNRTLKLKTKLMVYKAVVIPTLLYSCETWTLYRKDLKRLERFHQRKLRSILRISWEDRVTNNEVFRRSEMKSIEADILLHQLRWTGHMERMPDTRLPRQILYGELEEGTRPRGGPKRRYKDQLRRTFAKFSIEEKSWTVTARNRNAWRKQCHDGRETFEINRREELEAKRRKRKERQRMVSFELPNFICDICGRGVHSRIGLVSHRGTHGRPRAGT